METYNKPKVYLISEPKINWLQVSEFFKDYHLSWTEQQRIEEQDYPTLDSYNKALENSNGDLLTEFAGRICYVSFGDKQGRKTNKEYIDNIVSSGHGSVMEHANYTFLATKVSRGYTHEMVRHRAGFGYSQESTHYIDYNAESGKMNIPVEMRKFKDLKEIMEISALQSFENYEKIYDGLRSQGVPKKEACSMARQVLPTGIESKLVFTGNIRALRHFIQARANEHNVMEIRDVALSVYDIMSVKAPNCFSDMKKTTGNDDYPIVSSMYRKV